MATRCIKKVKFLNGGFLLLAAHYFLSFWVGSAEIVLDAKCHLSTTFVVLAIPLTAASRWLQREGGNKT